MPEPEEPTTMTGGRVCLGLLPGIEKLDRVSQDLGQLLGSPQWSPLYPIILT